LLAGEFSKLGGELHAHSRWNRDEPNSEGIILATGRRMQPTENGWRWFGLKAHAREVRLNADLEMHVTSNCYIGVGITSGGATNICGLFRRRAGETVSAAVGLNLLRGPPGTSLRARLVDAVFDEKSFCAIAGLTLRPRRAEDQNECCIGDAITMIPPVTGNGMSMAFESGEIAIAPLTQYSLGKISWEEARRTIAHSCDVAFHRRLFWARLLQWMMFAAGPRPALGSIALRSDRLWQLMFAKTR
jgi:hypothetical protein